MSSHDLIAEFLGRAQGPVLILSSKAGLGNYRAGEALHQMAKGTRPVYHLPIEDLISPDLRRTEFDRHRLFCEKMPFIIELIYRTPLLYALKYAKEAIFKATALQTLLDFLAANKIETVIAANHRSAFWIGALKRRGLLQCRLWGCLTDYFFSPGWRFIFWDQVEGLWGPISPLQIPSRLRSRYQETGIPADPKLTTLANSQLDRKQILVTGGGWGLGPIRAAVQTLREAACEFKIHAVCGSNLKLKEELARIYRDDPAVFLYDELPSLLPLFEKCAAVVTKPGALTITEAHAAKRQIFLLPGLPVVEQANREFALANFGAKPFSARAIAAWSEETI